jgi:hypothetical protein
MLKKTQAFSADGVMPSVKAVKGKMVNEATISVSKFKLLLMKHFDIRCSAGYERRRPCTRSLNPLF